MRGEGEWVSLSERNIEKKSCLLEMAEMKGHLMLGEDTHTTHTLAHTHTLSHTHTVSLTHPVSHTHTHTHTHTHRLSHTRGLNFQGAPAPGILIPTGLR